MKKYLTAFIAVLFLVSTVFVNPAGATIVLNNTSFQADRPCEALQSIRKGTNPGNVSLVPGETYEVLGKNRTNETHYLLRISGVGTPRWVVTNCGVLFDDGGGEVIIPPSPIDEEENDVFEDNDNDYLLAISWQPAFCETHEDKLECQLQAEGDFSETNFTLHGLWPQPRGREYCGDRLSNRNSWPNLPELPGFTNDELDDFLEDLTEVMPGVSSYLQRHEWHKHGTCYSSSAREYYEESVALLQQINNSIIQDLFQANIGQSLTSRQITDAFDQAFGANAGRKVRIRCNEDKGIEMISELWINLKGEIVSDTSIPELLAGNLANSTPIEELIQNAPNARGRQCDGGVVDPVGFF